MPKKKTITEPERAPPPSRSTGLTAENVRDSALLLLTPYEAALRLQVTEEAFRAAIAAGSSLRASWEDGRNVARTSLHRSALAAAKGGSVGAMRYVEELLERQEAAATTTPPTPAEEAAPVIAGRISAPGSSSTSGLLAGKLRRGKAGA